MVDITFKQNTLRKAIATAVLHVSSVDTIQAIQNRTVPKGDVFEFARAAGLLAIKKTSDVIPDCHPLPVEYAAITYTIEGLSVLIQVEVHTIYKTGVEVEAMHGASITALTMYDMLKPIDKQVEIGTIRLASKKGGKSDKATPDTSLKAAVIVCSDSVSTGLKEDLSGKYIQQKLLDMGLRAVSYSAIPDDKQVIQETAVQLANQGKQLVIFTGGTGVSDRDVTPESLLPLINKPIDGIMETARSYGQQRTPYAMLSRGVAGFYNDTLLLTFPGSLKAVEEYMQVIFPAIFHAFPIKKGGGHA